MAVSVNFPLIASVSRSWLLNKRLAKFPMTKKFLKKNWKPTFPQTMQLPSKTTRMQCAGQYDPQGSLAHLYENCRSEGHLEGLPFSWDGVFGGYSAFQSQKCFRIEPNVFIYSSRSM